MKNHSFNFIFNRFVIIINTVAIIFLASISYILNTQIQQAYNTKASLNNIISEVNAVLIFVVLISTALNITLFILLTIYSSKKYFKVMEKLDFEDLESAIAILNHTKNFDEIGYLGTQVSKILKVYSEYAFSHKKRLHFEKLKSHTYFEQIQSGAILLSRSSKNYLDWVIYNLNKKATSFMGIENKSSLIGEPFHILLSKQSYKEFLDILKNKVVLQSLEKEKIKPISFPLGIFLEDIDTPLKFKSTMLPFVFEFPDSYSLQDTQNFPSNQNLIIDSILILIEPEVEESEN